MSWTNLIVQINKKEVDSISDFLIEIGATSTSIEDSNLNQNKEELIFGEPHNQSQQFWENNTVQALFEKSIDIEIIKAALVTKFNASNFAIEVHDVQDQDWVKLTKSQFLPINILNKLWIIPSWHEIQDRKAINLILDPGLAFGTGAHATTHLCLLWLLKNVDKNIEILDYGCGSGILGIAAKKIGAKKVFGVDIDEQAIKSSQDNGKINNVEIVWSNADSKIDYKVDLVVANILSSALIVLAPVLAEQCKTKGKIALSGILKKQEKELKTIYSQWFDFEPSEYKDGWVLISGIKF
jgi:ribosomal protein L11 methyltransferase|tara:strand:+ start:2412 stop:3299 length:888 start_codon:yes stop_codon:yes gene_type:complete